MFDEAMQAEIEALFGNIRQGAFVSKQAAQTPYEEMVGAGQINPSGWVVNSDSDGLGASVTIDAEGITIRNGRLLLADQFGNNVITGAGFGASWLDFISTGFYNGNFQVGTTNDITAATETGGADTEAEYLASLSDDIPYWIVQSESGAGTLKRVVDSTAVGGFALQWAGNENAIVYQDIPIVSGQFYSIYLNWRYTNSASEFQREIGYQFRTSSHAAIGSEVDAGLAFTTSLAAYGIEQVATTAIAPANARYLRVLVHISRTSGSPTIWVNSVVAKEQVFYGNMQIGNTLSFGGITFYNPSFNGIINSILGTSSGPMYVINSDGSMEWGPSSGAGSDSRFYRSGTKHLEMDDTAGGNLTMLSLNSVEVEVPNGFVRTYRTGAGLTSFMGMVAGDTGPRVWLGTSGVLRFDDGSHAAGSGDSGILRVAAGNIATVGNGTASEIWFSTTSATTERGAIVEDGNNLNIGRYVSGAGGAYVSAFRAGANATNALVGFFGTAPIAKGAVTGSRGGNAALASLLTLLANYGLLTDSST